MSPMSLAMNPSLLQYASRSSSTAPPAEARPAPPSSSPQAPSDSSTVTGGKGEVPMDMINSAAVNAILSSGIKAGEQVTIRSSDGEAVIIAKKGVSTFDTIKRASSEMFHTAAAEASNVVAQDPAFAFKAAAFAVQGQVFAGIPSEFTSVAGQAFLPMVRVVSIALDLKKAHETWKDERSSKIDKTIVGGHLVTDVLGIGGAIAMAVPALAPAVGITLSAVGLMGDLAAYGYHVMKYFRDRPYQGDPDGKAPTA